MLRTGYLRLRPAAGAETTDQLRIECPRRGPVSPRVCLACTHGGGFLIDLERMSGFVRCGWKPPEVPLSVRGPSEASLARALERMGRSARRAA